jgi:lipopolysaccharide/colanic/teichoic acid biosynthesis glycosyltransferase
MTSVRIQQTSRRERLALSARRVEEAARRAGDDAVRRALNLAVAAAGIVMAAPLMLLIAGVIKLTSRGPVIYTQQRVGVDRRSPGSGQNHRRRHDLGGKPFTIYKFRTMRRRQATADEQVWASPEDPRVTMVGRVLRNYRLDELPQLFNVLLGDMNVVGPRPEQPRIFHELQQEIDGYRERQRVLPGITGWAQINNGYDLSVDDVRRKVAYDLEYVTRCSALHDLQIMLRTFPVMALRKGAW